MKDRRGYAASMVLAVSAVLFAVCAAAEDFEVPNYWATASHLRN
jgi:hypothetical protein